MSCTICCNWPMISNLRSSEWLLRTGALQRQLQVFTEMIQERFFLVVLRSSSQYYTCQLFLSQMCEIFTLFWPRFPETSRRLPKISDEFPKTSERCWKLSVRRLFPKTFEHFRSHLKDDTFSVLWYDFLRTENRTQSHLSGFVTQAWDPVAGPDLQIRGGGGGKLNRPWDKGRGAVLKKNVFRPFGPPFVRFFRLSICPLPWIRLWDQCL